MRKRKNVLVRTMLIFFIFVFAFSAATVIMRGYSRRSVSTSYYISSIN